MLTEARGKARSRLISAVLRNFAYWPRGRLQLPQGVGHPHLLDDLAKTLRFLLQPTAQRGLAEKEHFRHPRHAPCLRRRQHNQLPHLRRQILLPLDEQRARIASLMQGQQQPHGLVLLQRDGQSLPHRLQNALPHKRQLCRHRCAK